MISNSYYDSDERIAKFIREWKTEYYDEMISGDESRKLTFHLSRLRNALLCRYPFDKTGSALEIGAGFGALTGLLSDTFDHVDAVCETPLRAECLRERYSRRSNIDVTLRLSDALSEEKKYDFILALEEPDEEPWIVKLAAGAEMLKEHLDDDGVMLLGLRDATARELLTKVLKTAGFYYIREYYPLPDICITQEIYSQDRLPDASCASRIDFFSPDGSVPAERYAAEIIGRASNGTFAERPPCVLLECRRSEQKNPLSYLSVTMDRDKEHASCLTCRGPVTEKSALFAEGDAHIGRQAENLTRLRGRGLGIVPVSVSGMLKGPEGSRFIIKMPTVTGRTLLDILSETKSRDEIIRLFEKLHADVIASSDIAREDAERGPVLKTAYLDMIPANIFYSGPADMFTYFDQEFTKENAPASFVMYRAIRYTWGALPVLEDVMPMREMMGRFGIDEVTEASFAEEEDAMTAKVRNCELYSQLFAWKKETAPEIFEPDPLHKAVRKVQLDLLKKLDTVCEIYHLRYMAVFGTMLGAVRDEGMVPWDDDIDIAMPRIDYDRLCTVAAEAFERPYFLQTPESDPECFYGGYAKLRNSDTTAAEWFNEGKDCNQGIWIDIFPLDDCAADEEGLKDQQRKVYFRQRLLYAKRYPLWANRMIDSDPKKLSLYYILSSKKSDKKMCKDLYRACTKYPMSGYLTIFACYYSWRGNRNLFRADDIKHLVRVPFEDMTIPVPENYKEWLEKRYGKSFLARPPKERRSPHHEAKYDPEKPYKLYVKTAPKDKTPDGEGEADE